MIIQHAMKHQATHNVTVRDSLTPAQRIVANQIMNIPCDYEGYIKFGNIWCYVTDCELDVLYMFLDDEWECVRDLKVAARILA